MRVQYDLPLRFPDIERNAEMSRRGYGAAERHRLYASSGVGRVGADMTSDQFARHKLNEAALDIGARYGVNVVSCLIAIRVADDSSIDSFTSARTRFDLHIGKSGALRGSN